MIQRALDVGIQALVIPAVDAAHWPSLRALCAAQTSILHAAFGLHPLFEHPDPAVDLVPWLDRAVAIGECGLDGGTQSPPAAQQLTLLRRQLDVALEHDLPVILHARKALDPLLRELRRRSKLRGVVHAFVGSEQQAWQLVERGFYLGIGGSVTYPRAQRLHRVVRAMPQTALLLETDAPDQPLCGFQGQRNEPCRLLQVLHALAQWRDESPDELAAATTRNARRLFALPGVHNDVSSA